MTIAKPGRAGLRAALLIGAALGAVGCTLGPDYERPKLDAQLGERFHGSPDGVSSGARDAGSEPGPAKADDAALARWWTSFNDAGLNALVDEALSGNLRLLEARARILEARALRGVAKGGLFPALSGSADVTHQELGDKAIEARTQGFGGGFRAPAQVDFETWQAGVGASWELDLFGRVRRLVEAAEREEEALVEAARAIRVSLLAELAAAWFEVRALERRIAVTRDSLALQTAALELVRDQARAGLISELEPARAESLLAATRAGLPQLASARRRTLLRIDRLAGRRPDPRRAALADSALDRPLPGPPDPGPPGLPADLLRRRPDLRRAEAQLAAETARIGARQAERLPRLSLTGSFAFSAADAKTLGDFGARTWSVGPTLVVPIFEGGRLAARVDQAEARAGAAELALRQAVLVAVEETEGALARLQRGRERVRALTDAASAARRAERLADDLFEAGSTSFLAVIDARRERNRLENDLITARQAVLAATVQLYRALGGGWQVEPTPAEPS